MNWLLPWIRSSICEERRVWIRSRAAGDALRPENTGPQPAERAAQLGGLGKADAGRPEEAGATDGPAAGGAVLLQGGSGSGAAHPAVPHGRPEEPPVHEGSGGDTGARRGNKGAVERAQKQPPAVGCGRGSLPRTWPGRSAAAPRRRRCSAAPQREMTMMSG